jgi:hypothetical protein
MDRQRIVLGVSASLLFFGLIVLCFTEGGIFNPVIPYTYLPRKTSSHPEWAYVDLTQHGPLSGVALIQVGALGLVYARSRKRDGSSGSSAVR